MTGKTDDLIKQVSASIHAFLMAQPQEKVVEICTSLLSDLYIAAYHDGGDDGVKDRVAFAAILARTIFEETSK